ncbi:MAG: phosphate signaling complex protein PhoU [Defluviitaleaceae bacterium]|nr:phosphate signaling complex protein PhoU [Defluviitaleaceae bacterium]
MRKRLEFALEEINNDIIEMGTLVEISIERAMTALKNQDITLAKSVRKYQKKVDEMEKQIESSALHILVTQQPVASDLRLISVALKIITDMQRISNQAFNIAEISTQLVQNTFLKKPDLILEMAEKTVSMVSRALDAFVNRDRSMADSVEQDDDEIDKLFVKVRDEVVEMIHENKQNGEQAIDLIMIAKYLERIADHAVNISDWVVFFITSKHREG